MKILESRFKNKTDSGLSKPSFWHKGEMSNIVRIKPFFKIWSIFIKNWLLTFEILELTEEEIVMTVLYGRDFGKSWPVI